MFIACESATPWRELLADQRAICFQFDLPDYATRLRLWENAVAAVDREVAGPELEALADRFVLTPAQISAATQSAVDSGYLSDRESSVSSRCGGAL